MRHEFSYPTVTPIVRRRGGQAEVALDDRPAPAPSPAGASYGCGSTGPKPVRVMTPQSVRPRA